MIFPILSFLIGISLGVDARKRNVSIRRGLFLLCLITVCVPLLFGLLGLLPQGSGFLNHSRLVVIMEGQIWVILFSYILPSDEFRNLFGFVDIMFYPENSLALALIVFGWLVSATLAPILGVTLGGFAYSWWNKTFSQQKEPSEES